MVLARRQSTQHTSQIRGLESCVHSRKLLVREIGPVVMLYLTEGSLVLSAWFIAVLGFKEEDARWILVVTNAAIHCVTNVTPESRTRVSSGTVTRRMHVPAEKAAGRAERAH